MLFLLAAIPILFIVYVWWHQNLSHVARHVNKLPGPGIPIFGTFLDYFFGDLEKIFQNDRDRAAKFSPIFKMWVFYKASLFFQDPKDIEVLLSSTKHIKKSQIYDNLHMWLGTGLLTSDGDKWKLRRKMLTPAFHFTILKNFVDVFNEASENLVQNLKERLGGDYIDVNPPITEFTLESVAETSMGISLDMKKDTSRKYKQAILDFCEASVKRLSQPWLQDQRLFELFPLSFKAKQAVKILHSFTRNIIQERKESSKGGSYTVRKRLVMLDLLIKAQEVEGKIDDEGIREEVDTFMFEGHDTTAVAICYLLLLLANNPQAQSEARQEILDVLGETNPPTYNNLQNLLYTERCIKETLRLFPSVPLIGRNIEEDFKSASGYTVPKGSMVHIFIFDLHRDPRLYSDPLKFDPDRFLPENIQKRHHFAYIPFSAGSRNCIGQKFATLELKAVLCAVLREFVLEPVDTPEGVVFQADLVLRSRDPIRIKFVKRKK